MKYYEMHDPVYDSLRKDGKVSWDGASDLKDLGLHSINIALKKKLNDVGKTTLDLGTGAGNSALFLASKGFEVDGLDVSQTAVNMAQANAEKLNLKVNFQVSDLLEFESDKKYELVVDSSCLHCIVLEEDRTKFYAVVKRCLGENGLFFVHTMTRSSDMINMTSKKHLYLEGDVLWTTGKSEWDIETKEIEGRAVFPHRKIMSKNDLELEFVKNGFSIVDCEVLSDPGNPDTYTAWLVASLDRS